MAITQLSLTNFRGFEGRVTLDFERDLTVLVGVNGSGKSTVIDALWYCLDWYLQEIFVLPGQAKELGMTDIFLQADQAEIGVVWDREETRETERVAFDLRPEGAVLQEELEPVWANVKKRFQADLRRRAADVDIPVIRGFFPGRGMEAEPARKDAALLIPQTAANLPGGLDSFLTWFIDQTNIENQQKIQERNFDLVNPRLEVVRNALSRFLEAFPGAKFGNVRVGESRSFQNRVSRQTLLLDKNDRTLELNQLSDGEKGALAIVFDIAYRLSIANPDSSKALQGHGTVLIDEIDLHLHPSWQRSIIQCLQATFPNFQFVLTTHSPLILSQLKPRHIRVLQEGQIWKLDEFLGNFNSYGAGLEDILVHIQGVEKVVPDDLSEMLEAFFSLIESDKIEEANLHKKKLEVMTDPQHPDILKGQRLMDLKKLRIR